MEKEIKKIKMDAFISICGFLIEKKYNFEYEHARWSIDITKNMFDVNDLFQLDKEISKYNNVTKYDLLFYIDFNEGTLKIRCQHG